MQEMIASYQGKGLSVELASARVCQDVVLNAIAESPLGKNVTIKGGVVMRSITQNMRRSTRDIDLDFIHYSLDEKSIRRFVDALNCLQGISISVDGSIEELKHQDYHGKCVHIRITDGFGTSITTKMDIGVHRHFELEQDEFCFDVCTDENGVCLLKNSVEQTFVEKLRSLLIFGSFSRRYKDVFDMFFLKNLVDSAKLDDAVKFLIFDDENMREKSYGDIVNRIEATFDDVLYLKRVADSKQRWLDNDIVEVSEGILSFFKKKCL